MFTGIIEDKGIIKSVERNGTNRTFWITSELAPHLKVDQSVAHNGVCLTVEELKINSFRVTAIEETLNKTNLGNWSIGTNVNLERCMQMNGRIDGHIVQGHVDSTGICKKITEKDGSWEIQIQTADIFKGLMVEKGSISLNGISLTIYNVHDEGFTVAIIPYTFNHTNLSQLKENETVNLEFDMIGKYVQKNLVQYQH